MFKLSAFALLLLVPAAYCATTANNCRIAGTVVGAVLGTSNGATLETACANTASFCKNNRKKNTNQRWGGSILASLSQSNRKRRGAGQVAEGAPSTACEVATEGKIAQAAKSKDPNELSKQIARVVCTPSNCADWVSACNEAVKAATVSKGFDLSTVEGCETIQYIDNLGKPCTPQAV